MKKFAQSQQTLRRKVFEILQKYNDKHEISLEIIDMIKSQRNLIEKMWREENK